MFMPTKYLICRHRTLKQNVEQTNTVWSGNVAWDMSVFLLPPIIHWILAYPAISGTFSFLSIPSDVGHIVEADLICFVLF